MSPGPAAHAEVRSQRCRPAVPELGRAPGRVDEHRRRVPGAARRRPTRRAGQPRRTPASRSVPRGHPRRTVQRVSSAAGPASTAASARTALRSWPIAAAACNPRPTTSPTTRAIRSRSRKNASYQSPPTSGRRQRAGSTPTARAGGRRQVRRQHAVLQGGGHPLLLVGEPGPVQRLARLAAQRLSSRSSSGLATSAATTTASTPTVSSPASRGASSSRPRVGRAGAAPRRRCRSVRRARPPVEQRVATGQICTCRSPARIRSPSRCRRRPTATRCHRASRPRRRSHRRRRGRGRPAATTWLTSSTVNAAASPATTCSTASSRRSLARPGVGRPAARARTLAVAGVEDRGADSDRRAASSVHQRELTSTGAGCRPRGPGPARSRARRPASAAAARSASRGRSGCRRSAGHEPATPTSSSRGSRSTSGRSG